VGIETKANVPRGTFNPFLLNHHSHSTIISFEMAHPSLPVTVMVYVPLFGISIIWIFSTVPLGVYHK